MDPESLSTDQSGSPKGWTYSWIRSQQFGQVVDATQLPLHTAQNHLKRDLILQYENTWATQLICWYSITISIFFIFRFSVRLWKLRGKNVKVFTSPRLFIKMLIYLIAFALQLLSLFLPPSQLLGTLHIEVLSVLLSSVSILWLGLVSFYDHRRTIRSSFVIIMYLVASLTGDVLLLTAPEENQYPLSNLMITSSAALKIALIFLESYSKESLLMPHYKQLPPEELAGIFGKAFFCWIHPILRNGYRNILRPEDIPQLERRLSSEELRRSILNAWDQRRKPETKHTLPVTLLRFARSAFIAPLLPRIFLIIFRYCQPVLINATVRFVNNGSQTEKKPSFGSWLIVLTSISTAVYHHRLNRLQVMLRSALVGLIHNRSMLVQSGRHEDGAPITLMSVDVDILSTTGEMLHETWAQMLEVIVGTGLLASQIGWLCLIPLVIVFCCSWVSVYVAKHLQSRQRNWYAATQKRMAVTAAMLQSVKSMKMLGISGSLKSFLSRLRVQEIEASKNLRWVMVGYNASANGLGMFAPVITLVLYASIARARGDSALPAETAFTSIALLAMVTHPANMVMTIVPRAIASLSNSERILKYMMQDTNEDHRLDIGKASLNISNYPESDREPAIILADTTIQYPHSSKPTLEQINCKIYKGSIVMCSGPVGAGKTTLARAILGEVTTSGSAILTSSKRIGVCSQEPWLPSGSIKDVICGGAKLDGRWYQTVLLACDLTNDLESLLKGDTTEIKFPGFNLSEGQRQRVALARVLYARCDIVILDDTFRALDGRTEKTIVDNLLGPGGIFRKQGTTVLVITNSAQYFPLADQILILSDSKVQMQGTWSELRLKVQQIAKFIPNEVVDKDALQIKSTVGTDTKAVSRIDAAQDLTRQSGDLTLYKYYLNALGVWNGLFMMIFTALYSFFITFSQYWLKWWTEADSKCTPFYMGGYMILALAAWISTNGTMWSTQIRIAPKSGTVLHNRLLDTIVGAPLSYFSDNKIGIILNRFGEDIKLVDRQLPAAFAALATQVCKLLVQATILFSVNREMAATLPLCIIAVFLVQRIYLRTSRQLRFLEIESMSALYSSVIETVDGLSTIRALNWQQKCEGDILKTIDSSQRPSYLLFCLQRWLNLVLDLLIAAVAVGLVALSITFQGTNGAASVGVSLNMIILANTTLLRLVENWTTLEVSLGAIARLRSVVAETPQEENNHEQNWVPPTNWPVSGDIVVQNVEASYSPEKLALESINLEVNDGQKVIICGRTGSGKSTLLLSLLRLLDSQCGSIIVDGIDTSNIHKTYLRRHCYITVPQDPFILTSATLRFNLDPDETMPATTLIQALEKTGLWKHFHHFSKLGHQGLLLSDEALLDLPMSSLPPLSAGQLQLLSLSRALAHAQAVSDSTFCNLYTTPSPEKRKPIVLLDEATSAMDPDTDGLMQDVIEEEFTRKGYTVILVAHRVSNIVKGFRDGVDAVVWMAEGRIERVAHTQQDAGLGSEDGGEEGST